MAVTNSDVLAVVRKLAVRFDEVVDELENHARLSRKDVLRHFGVSDSTLRRRIALGQFPAAERDLAGKPFWTLKVIVRLSHQSADSDKSAVRIVRPKMSDVGT